MSYATVKFIGSEYSIPEDVLQYIDLLDFTDDIKRRLINAFFRELEKGIEYIDDKNFVVKEMHPQIKKYIAKLCENDIYTRTVSDYLDGNKGLELFNAVNNEAFNKIKSILIEKINTFQEGYEDALNKAESSITGMGFSIWSGSFINHAIYAAMESSTIDEQTKRASSQYERDIAELEKRVIAKYDGAEKEYINNTFIPHMETALTAFAYELLDKYIADLVAHQKFDPKALEYVNISRSNELLENLELSKSKTAILQSAFVACPFNLQVYGNAMKHELLDYESFQTAQYFKQGGKILAFLKGNLGEVSYPTVFKPDYYCAELLAMYTDCSTVDVLRELTAPYADAVVAQYAKVVDLLTSKGRCSKVMQKASDKAILEGDKISKQLATSVVDQVISTSIWDELTSRCGYNDLPGQLVKLLPEAPSTSGKAEFDVFLKRRLYKVFEDVRQILAKQITKTEQEREQARERSRVQAEEKKDRELAERKRKTKLYSILGCTAGLILLAAIGLTFIFNTVLIPNSKYDDAVALLESDNYQEAYDILVSLDGYKDSEKLVEQCELGFLEIKYAEAVQLAQSEKYEEAISIFDGLGGYKDSTSLIEKYKICILDKTYNHAVQLMADEKYADAISAFEALGDYKDSAELNAKCQNENRILTYSNAVEMINEGKYEAAYKALVSLGDYKDCKELLKRFKTVYTESSFTTITYHRTDNNSYTYDSNGNLVTKDFENGTMVTEYTYDVYDRLVNKVTTFDDGRESSVTNSYNDAGNISQSKYLDSYGDLTTTDFYYDADGYLIKEVAVEGDEEKITEYEYDINGRVIMKQELYYGSTSEYTYGENNELVKVIYTASDGDKTTYDYIYDENSYLVQVIRTSSWQWRNNSNGELNDEVYAEDFTEYIYDENYFLIEKAEYDDGEKESYTTYGGYLVFYTDANS